MRQAAASDGCVVLNLLLQLQTRRQLTLAMKRQIWQIWLAKSAKVPSLVVVRQFRLHHIHLSKKVIFWWIFNFFTGDCGLGEGSWF